MHARSTESWQQQQNTRRARAARAATGSKLLIGYRGCHLGYLVGGYLGYQVD